MLFHLLRPVRVVVVSRFVAIAADGPRDVPSYRRPGASSTYVPTTADAFKDGNDGNDGNWSRFTIHIGNEPNVQYARVLPATDGSET